MQRMTYQAPLLYRGGAFYLFFLFAEKERTKEKLPKNPN